MQYYSVNPEAAADLGADTKMTMTGAPEPEVVSLHCEFVCWLGSDIVRCFPEYVVSDKLAAALSSSGLSGFELEGAQVTKEKQYELIYPEKRLPGFKWLKVRGMAGVDDFGLQIGKSPWLVVSEEALKILRRFSLIECDITPVSCPATNE